MTRLQIALDVASKQEALALTKQVHSVADIIEVGTPLIKAQGLKIISVLKTITGKSLILADMKTMDAGSWEAQLAFEAGADIVTVCGVAPLQTITEAVQAAKNWPTPVKVMVDLIGVSDMVSRIEQFHLAGADFICIHTGIDEQAQGKTPLAHLKRVAENRTLPLAVAGGIGIKHLPEIMPYQPEIIIVGSAITKADNPYRAAQQIKKEIEKHQNNHPGG